MAMTEDEYQEKVLGQIPAKATVRCVDNGLRAIVTITPPQNGGKKLSKSDLLDLLKQAGISKGILDDAITQLAEYPTYDEAVTVASGVEPIDGKDAEITYMFDHNSSLKPQEDENGLMDYKNINFINSVDKDQVLAEITLPTVATPGVGVKGETIQGKDGKKAADICGENTYLSEDGQRLYAAIDGSVSMRKGKVTVSRTITVSDVDLSTGNLLYVGSIIVEGNIADGFTVSGSEGVVVKGTVGNAKIMSGKDVVIGQGVSGEQAQIVAGGDVRSRFLEHCTVKAKGNVYADAVIQSNITAGGEILVKGRRGCIIGGKSQAGRGITTQIAGNDRYIPTHLEVVGTYLMKRELEDLEEKRQEQQNMLSSTEQLLTVLAEKIATDGLTEEWQDARMNARETKEATLQEIAQIDEKVAGIQQEIDSFDGNSSVRVTCNMYGNVLLTIEGVTMENEEHCGATSVYRVNDHLMFTGR